MPYENVVSVNTARHFADTQYHEGWNNYNIFSYWQYGSYYNPWCDSFVCYCAHGSGFRFPDYSACGEKGDFNVTSHRLHAMRQGIWRTRSYRAKPGDLVVLSWGVPDQHIEMVLSDAGGSTIACIGGNTADRVAYRLRYRANVVGFIALSEAGQGAPVPVPPKTPAPAEEEEMPTMIPARAESVNGRIATYELDSRNKVVKVKNGWKLKWRLPGSMPATEKAKWNTPVVFGVARAYKIPIAGPYTDIIEDKEAIKVRGADGKEKTMFRERNVGVVTAEDGGCAFFDIVAP
jgi:hypothetical protein